MTSKRLHFNVITLMPEMFEALDFGLIGKAFRDGKVSKTLINPRDDDLVLPPEKHESTEPIDSETLEVSTKEPKPEL